MTTSPPDTDISDPRKDRPLCDEALFTTVLNRMVADHAPHLFAIVAEYGERADAAIAAWGLAFGDHVEIVSTVHKLRVSVPTPQQALRLFAFSAHVRPRIVWFDPEAATPGEGEPDALAHAEFEL